MQKLSAYSLLQKFEQQSELEIISNRNEFLKDSTYVIEVLVKESNLIQNEFLKSQHLQDNLLTENSFLQIIKNRQVNTQIATMGTPYALTMYEKNFKNQDDLYKYIVRNLNDTFTIQEIRHNSYTVSVSFCELLKSFIISSSGQTIICQDENDIQQYSSKKDTERTSLVAKLFFEVYHKLDFQQQINLAQDLIHRSLVGYRNLYNVIEWYSIMEHYEQQRILSPDVVKKFLNHYNLHPAKSNEQQINLQQFPSICDSIQNQLIDSYHDYFKGNTIYFWNGDKYLGNCFIPSKHYEILRKTQDLYFNHKLQDKQKEFQNLLSQFNLNQSEENFYFKLLNIIFNVTYEQKQIYKFPKLLNIAFFCVYNNLNRISQKIGQGITLAQCLQEKLKVVVLIPVGITGMGYDEVCQIILKLNEGVKLVSKIDQIDGYQKLYLYDQICSLQKLQSINDQLKQLPYDVRTIALYPESSCYYLSKEQSRFPFSFKFIMFCLLQVLDNRNQVNEIINQLKGFENKNLNHLPTDYQISCQYMPQTKETDDLYSELVESDFIDAFSLTNDYLIESLSQYKDSIGNIPEKHLWNQAKRIINTVEEKVKINIEQRKQKYIKNQINKSQEYKYGLYIQKPNWEEIDNFIFDCLEIMIKYYPRDSKINIMYQQLKKQLFNQKYNSQIYRREEQPFMLLSKRQEQNKWITQVQIAVIVVDGIIILQPQDLGLNILQDIPIYSHDIEVLNSIRIAELVKQDVEELQNEKIMDETYRTRRIELNHKIWSVYVVKLKPIKIELVQNIIY